jgi:hypothetical protein
VDEEDIEVYIPKSIYIPELKVISETPSIFDKTGAVHVNKNGDGKYRKRP